MLTFICLGLLPFIGLVATAEEKVVCYYGSWATYRNGNGKFGVENIDPYLCTHIIYSFLGISQDGSLKILYAYLDLEENWGRGNLKKFIDLNTINPQLKLMIAIGGWNEGSLGFSIVARDAVKRQKFANEVLQFCLKMGFDGFDVDWEYPGQRDGELMLDKANFVLLLQELNSKLAPNGILLTVAVAATENSATISYDIPSISRYVDFINLMTYDLHGPWDDTVGLNAPLYEGNADHTVVEKQLNVNATVYFWLRNGTPKHKLIVGMPFYGRTFSLRDSTETVVGSNHNGPGVAGQYTNKPGFLGYNEICEKQVSEHWLRNWEPRQQGSYIVSGDQWIGYDDTESLTIKSQFVMDEGLGGVMVWSLETDDFRNVCGKGKFPLLSAINSVVRNESSGTTSTVTTESTVTENEVPSTGQPPDESFVCKSDGIFKDPIDCSKFYVCVDANIYALTCPNGLLFNTKTNTCDWPNEVDC